VEVPSVGNPGVRRADDRFGEINALGQDELFPCRRFQLARAGVNQLLQTLTGLVDGLANRFAIDRIEATEPSIEPRERRSPSEDLTLD
jgi:hypothetical protein